MHEERSSKLDGKRAGQPDTDDEQAIIERSRHDRQAFGPLYDRYVDAIYCYYYRRLGNRQAAEDATSQVFVKAIAAMPGYRGRSFRSWLFPIAHNTVIDAWRRQRPERPLDDAGMTADSGLSPEDNALVADARTTLRIYLAQLSPDQRAVVELRLAGRSGADIATALERSEGSVKLLQFRAINRLRTLLGVEIADEEETRDAAPVQQPGC